MTAAKTTFRVTLPDGRVATRTSAHPYTHVVIVDSIPWNSKEYSWGAWSWSAKLENATKEARRVEARIVGGKSTTREVRVVEVDR